MIASLIDDVNWTFVVDSPLSFPLLLDLKEDFDFLLLLSTMIYIYDGLWYTSTLLPDIVALKQS
jgi:hypothetical protein